MMKKNSWLAVAVISVACIAGLTTTTQARPTIFPTGVTIYDPERAYNAYFIETPYAKYANHPSGYYRSTDMDAGNTVYLRDMNGRVVHQWELEGSGSCRARLQPNGDLVYMDDVTGEFYKADWNGKVLSKFQGIGFPRTDFRVVDENHVLYNSAFAIGPELTKDLKDVKLPWFGNKKRKGITLTGDSLIISDWKGNIVWRWNSWEHLDMNDFSPMTPIADWTHGNTCSIIPENKWYDAGDKRFKPGNIIFNPRNLDRFFVIDRETKEIVWSWSHNENGGMAHCHEPEMIAKGLPGEGNILVFDNGLFPKTRARVGQTIIYEVNPSTDEVVWRYYTQGYSNSAFFSKTMGSQQRMPNGNTFISEDNQGRLFQVVTSNKHPDGGEIVWEYVSHSNLQRSNVYPYDFTPQLREMGKPKELKVTPPHNFYTEVKPDAERKSAEDVFRITPYDPEPKYPVTSGITPLGFSVALATVDELMLINDIEMTRELAEAIFLYARENGGFKVPSDVAKVPGLTKEQFEKLSLKTSDYTSDVLYTGSFKGGMKSYGAPTH